MFQWAFRPIDEQTAKSILAITHNQHSCYIQWADEYSPHLTQPLLWDFAHWHAQCDKWLRDREKAKLFQIEWEIKKFNIKLATKQFMDIACMDYEQALKCVSIIVERGNYHHKLKAMGVVGLVVTEKEMK